MSDFEQVLQQTNEIGFVESTSYPLVYLRGVPHARTDEIIYFESGQFGRVVSLNEETVEVLVFSKKPVKLETRATRTGKKISVPVGDSLLGMSIDSLGRSLIKDTPVDKSLQKRPIDIRAPGLLQRKKISEPFLTGVSIIDLMLPLGRGQRELLIGDRKTGKTALALQILMKQANSNTICVYASIGKKRSDIKYIQDFFKKNGISDKCVLIASGANDPLGHIHLTPYTAMTVAEYFRDQGRDVLLILDDMTNHAKYYREAALLAKKFPGRDSYPGDIFFTHSRLLERAGNFETGSITCLPIVNTVEGDISGYIQTNLMSMTDGHIYFDTDLFNAGQRPSVNQFYSVTRVGRQTQTPLRWSINRELNSFFTLYRRTKNFVHFGAELNEGIKSTLDLGTKIMNFFNQSPTSTYDITFQMVVVCVLWGGLWTNKSIEDLEKSLIRLVRNYEKEEQFRANMQQIIQDSSDINALLGNFMKELSKNEMYL